MSKAFIASWRVSMVSTVILLCYAGLFGRLYYLHVWKREKLALIAERNRENVVIEQARRGKIVDSRGNLLAANRAVIELGVDPELVDSIDDWKYERLARLIKASEKEIRKNLRRGVYYVKEGESRRKRFVRWRKISDGVDEATYEKVMGLGIGGVYGNRKYERTYPGGELAAHLLGFLNKEEKAVTGVERYMDFYLKGQDGWRETERDGRRQELAQFRSREVEPADGLTVEMTIDSAVQHIIEEELERVAADYRPESATVVVSEPATGFILGLANYPTYDPNRFWGFPLEAHRNRAVTDVYEPGSTFKIVAASGVLNEGLANLETILDCTRRAVKDGEALVNLPEDYREFGLLSLKEVVSKSSNRGAAQLGVLLGKHQLRMYAHAFGFGEETGYGLGGEVGGTLHPVSAWDGLTIGRLPIGYTVNATPLQMHFAMSVIANGGILMTPRAVGRILDETGKPVVNFSPRPKRRVISNGTAEAMAGVLMEVAGPSGTAPLAAIPGHEVAGKTGTARKLVDGRYSDSHHIASFTGFFPASRPRILITVLVNDPSTGGPAYGGRVAAPAFRNVAEKLIQYYAIRPTREGVDLLAWKGGSVGRGR